MKRIIILLSILLMLTNLNIYAYAESMEIKNELEKVHYCPGNTPDGKHHFFRSYRNASVTLKNNSGKKVKSWDGIPCHCKHCKTYLWVSLNLKEYINGGDIKKKGMTGYWAYAKNVHPVNSKEMVFFK